MKYKYIPQKPYCCVPACVSMILHRRKLPVLAQTDIAYDLGVILPLKDRRLLPKFHKGLKPKAGWGTRINLKKYSLTAFLKKRGYRLEEKFYSAKKFQSIDKFNKFLSDNLKKENDLLICFDHSLLYGGKESFGHASLIEKAENKYAILRDPDSNHKNSRKVLLDKLFVALKNHHGGGIWVIK